MEILGLLYGASKDSGPPIEIISLTGPLFRVAPRYHTTLVVRLKGNGKMKARLCLRADTIGVRFSNLVSAPTVEPTMVRILASTAVTNRWDIVTAGVKRAFPQRQHLAINGRYVALPPPCLNLEGPVCDGSFSMKMCMWGGGILLDSAGYYQHHLDMCVF